MKNLGKILIGIGLYFASGNIVFLILNFFRFIFERIGIGFPYSIYDIVDKIVGGFLPYWVLDYGSFILITAGFIILVQTDGKVVKKKYINLQIIIGLVLGFIITIFARQIYQFFLEKGFYAIFNVMNIIRIVSYALIIIGYIKLLGINFGDNKKTIKENTESMQNIQPLPETKFTGGVLPIFLFTLWFAPLMAITLGFALPWIICIVIKWICENTTMGGKHLTFKGTGGGLFGRYILWSILTFLTIGIYGFWAIRNYIKWVVENIEMVD